MMSCANTTAHCACTALLVIQYLRLGDAQDGEGWWGMGDTAQGILPVFAHRRGQARSIVTQDARISAPVDVSEPTHFWLSVVGL